MVSGVPQPGYNAEPKRLEAATIDLSGGIMAVPEWQVFENTFASVCHNSICGKPL